MAEEWRVRVEGVGEGSGHPCLGEVWRLRGLRVEVHLVFFYGTRFENMSESWISSELWLRNGESELRGVERGVATRVWVRFGGERVDSRQVGG